MPATPPLHRKALMRHQLTTHSNNDISCSTSTHDCGQSGLSALVPLAQQSVLVVVVVLASTGVSACVHASPLGWNAPACVGSFRYFRRPQDLSRSCGRVDKCGVERRKCVVQLCTLVARVNWLLSCLVGRVEYNIESQLTPLWHREFRIQACVLEMFDFQGALYPEF